MKTTKISLMVVAIMLATVFVACKKESKNGENGEDIGFVINATDVQNSDSSIATVKAFIVPSLDTGNFYKVASAQYENNRFRLTLPATFPAEYLMNIAGGYGNEITSINISDKNANVGAVWIIGYDSNEHATIRTFIMADFQTYISVDYIYADRNFTIKGKYSDDNEDIDIDYDCSYKRGYNVSYTINHDPYSSGHKYYSCTTTKPSNADFKWYCAYTILPPLDKSFFIPLGMNRLVKER